MPRRLIILPLPLCLFISFSIAAPLAPLGVRGDLDAWNVGSVAAGRGPSAGYWNPALWGYYSEQAEMEFVWTDAAKGHPQHDDQGFFTNLGGLGFGVLHRDDPTGRMSINQYRLGLGFGEKGNYTGLAYGWNVGTWDAQKTPDHLVISSLNQFHRYASLGSTWTIAMGSRQMQPRSLLEAGLALRPLWDRATVSLDGSWAFDNDAFLNYSDRYWLGVELEPIDFVRLSARQAVNIGGNAGFEPDWTLQAGLCLRGAAFSAILPQTDRAGADPATRYSLLLGDHIFNRGLGLSHRKQLFARINLAGMAGEYPWLMVGQKFQLKKFLDQMDEAEKCPRLKGLFIDVKPDFQADFALLREIRQRIVEFKQKTGGEVAIYAHGYTLATLYLASAADRRAMLPTGGGQIDNLGRERLYLADALDEAGLDFVRYNIGAWKGAGEDLDKNAMSPEVRENVGRCLNDIYSHVTKTIQEGYGFSDAEMEGLLSRWFFPKNEMRERGLVDTLLYDDQVEDWVCRREPSDDDDKKKHDGITISIGFDREKLNKLKEDKVVTLASLQHHPVRRRWGVQPEVAVIYASGPIYSGRSLGPLAIGDETLVKQFKAAREDDNIKAVVFHIDSPGGSGYASDLVWREMMRLKKKKPLIVVQGFVAGSGGYYLSMAADSILSTPTTITGSIGVATGLFVDKGLMDNTRLRQDGVWAGKKESLGGAVLEAPLNFKAGSAQLRMPTLPVLGRPLTEPQTLELKAMIRDFYTDFVQKVADCRGKKWNEIHAIAEGRIWSGPEAQKLGLVDGQGGLRDAIELARQKAGLDKADMRVREIHPELSMADLFQLMQLMGQGGGMTAAQRRLFEQQTGLGKDLRLEILGSGKPELLIDDEPYQTFGW